MSKYFKYTPAMNEYTTLRFINDEQHELIVKTFDTNVVLLDGDEAEISSLTSKQPQEIEFTEINFDEFFARASKSAQAKFAISNLTKVFESECKLLTSGASVDEAMSWKKQEERARELLAGSASASPQLEVLAAARGRGETATEIATKIIENADAYELAYLEKLGKLHAGKRAVFSA